MHRLWQFIQAIYSDWISALSGSASVLLTFAGLTERRWFLVAAAVTFVVAAFRVWLKERVSLEQATKKGLSISDQTEMGGGVHRIRVRSKSSVNQRFGVDLKGVTPPVPGLDLPVPLRITQQPAERMAVLPGNGESLVDVIHTATPTIAGVAGVNYSPFPKGRYELIICAHSDSGTPDQKVFVVDLGKEPSEFFPYKATCNETLPPVT